MKTIALSVFRNKISSRLDVAEKMMIVSADDSNVKKKQIIQMQGSNPINKINTIIELKPDVLICGGLTKICEQMLKHNNIVVIPWMQGNSEEILQEYLDGLLPAIENERKGNNALQP